jgi:hypothetical protein
MPSVAERPQDRHGGIGTTVLTAIHNKCTVVLAMWRWAEHVDQLNGVRWLPSRDGRLF